MQIERRYAACQCFALFNCTEDYVLNPSTLYHLIIDKLLQFKNGVLQSLHVLRKHIVLNRILYLLVYDYNPFWFRLFLDFLGLILSNLVGNLFTESTNTFWKSWNLLLNLGEFFFAFAFILLTITELLYWGLKSWQSLIQLNLSIFLRHLFICQVSHLFIELWKFLFDLKQFGLLASLYRILFCILRLRL